MKQSVGLTTRPQSPRFWVCRTSKWGHGVIILSLVFAASITALPVAKTTFLADDHVMVETGRTIVESDFGLPFRGHFSGEVVPGLPAYFRPFFALSYAWDYWLWGYRSWGFRLTNVVLHIGCTLMVYYLVRLWCSGSSTAWLSALLFALHPVHGLAVYWISGRGDLLCGFFMLAAAGLYLVYLRKKNPLSYALSLVSMILATGSKEVAVTLPVILLGIAVFLPPQGMERQKILRALRPLLPFFVLAGFAVLIRIHLFGMGSFSSLFSLEAVPRAVWTLRRWILPLSLSLRDVAKEHTVWAAFAGTVGLSLFLILTPRLKGQPVRLGVLWSLLTLLPVLAIANPWRIYIPTMGFCMALGYLCTPEKNFRGVAGVLLSVAMFGIYFGETFTQGAAFRAADVAARGVASGYVEKPEQNRPNDPLFLAVPASVGDVPVYMFGLHIRLRWETGNTSLQPIICSYVVLPSRMDAHTVMITRVGERSWNLCLQNPRSRFEFPEIPEWADGARLTSGLIHTTSWGSVEVASVNPAGFAQSINLTIRPEILENRQCLYYYTTGKLNRLFR